MYKEFGIYTSEYKDSVSIIVELTEEQVVNLDIPMSVAFKKLTNETVKDWLYAHLYSLDDAFITTVDLNIHPEFFKDYGYLGQVDGLILQNELIEWIDKNKN